MSYFSHETAIIDDGCQIGDGTKIWHFSHILTKSKIGKNCMIGGQVGIAGHLSIADETKIQAQSGNSAGDGTWIDGGHFDIGFNNFTTSGIVNIQGIGDKSSLFISNPLNGDGSYNVSGLPHILLNMSKHNYITQFSGLSRFNPVLALTFTFTLLSIAGIPPLAGFFSKYLILINAVQNDFYLLAFVAVATSAISTFYYLRLIK